MSTTGVRFTDAAYEVVDRYASRHARELGHGFVGAGHLLLGLADYRGLTFDKLRDKFNLDPEMLHAALIDQIGRGNRTGDIERPFTDVLVDVIFPAAMYEASQLGTSQAGPEDLLLAILPNSQDPTLYGPRRVSRSSGEGSLALTLLNKVGVNVDTARTVIYEILRPHQSITS